MNTLLRTISLLLLMAGPVQAANEIRWNGPQLHVGMGSIVQSSDGIRIRANSSGQVFVSAPAKGITLDAFSSVEIELYDQPSDAQFFVAWRTSSGSEGMHPFSPLSAHEGIISISMSGEPNWQGTADQIGLGIQMAPYGEIRINSLSLLQPTILSRAKQRIHEWSSSIGWKPTDINFYTGSAVAEQDKFPVPFFARVLFVTLFCYLIYLLASGQIRKPNWHVAGVLILVCWVALDLLWQARLGQQVVATYHRFSGQTSSEKLLASNDAAIVQFIARVKDTIDPTAARMFLGSANDYVAMASAYYVAPINTYWNRRGQELPERKFLSRGDYILLIAPFNTRFNSASNVIDLPDSSELPVVVVLRDQIGMLLRVL